MRCLDKKGISIRNGNLQENLLLCAKPGEESFYVPLVIGDRYRRQSTLILQVVGKVLNQGGEGFWFGPWDSQAT